MNIIETHNLRKTFLLIGFGLITGLAALAMLWTTRLFRQAVA